MSEYERLVQERLQLEHDRGEILQERIQVFVETQKGLALLQEEQEIVLLLRQRPTKICGR